MTPTLTPTVLARYVDGSADNVNPMVTCETVDPSAFAELGTVTVLGTTAVTDAPARATSRPAAPSGRGARRLSTVTGSVTANKTWLIRLVRTEVGESVTVTNGSGRLDVATARICAGLNLIGNQTDAPTLVSDSEIGSVLNCRDNDPAPVHEDRPNRVAGPILGQCVGLGEG